MKTLLLAAQILALPLAAQVTEAPRAEASCAIAVAPFAPHSSSSISLGTWCLRGSRLFALQLTRSAPDTRSRFFTATIGGTSEDWVARARHRELSVAALTGWGFARGRILGWAGVGPAISRAEEYPLYFGPVAGNFISHFVPGWSKDNWRLGGQAGARVGLALGSQVGFALGNSLTVGGAGTQHSWWVALELGRLMTEERE